jgi:hypothetical protein
MGIEDSLGGYDYRRVQVAGFASFWLSKIEADNVTRSQHRARPSQRPCEQSGVGARCDPGEVLEQREVFPTAVSNSAARRFSSS